MGSYKWVISMVTILITHIWGLITLLKLPMNLQVRCRDHV